MTLLLRACHFLILIQIMLFFSPVSAHFRETYLEESEELLKKKGALSFLENEDMTLHEHNVKEWVNSEISKKLAESSAEYEKNQLENSEVRLPICDLGHPPLEWYFAEKEPYFRYLVHHGICSDDFHFLKWSGGDWVRFFEKQIENHNEGMICQNIWQEQPNQNNYIQVVLNHHVFDVVMQKQKILPMLQHAVLQMLMRTKEKPVQIIGQIVLTSTPALDEGFLCLELWERNKADWHLLHSVTGFVDDARYDVKKWIIKTKASAFSEIKMILKVDKKGLDAISGSSFLSRLYIYDAILRKSHQ